MGRIAPKGFLILATANALDSLRMRLDSLRWGPDRKLEHRLVKRGRRKKVGYLVKVVL